MGSEVNLMGVSEKNNRDDEEDGDFSEEEEKNMTINP